MAPYFERLASPRPTAEELIFRAQRLRLALDFGMLPKVPVVGIGHSIGATVLIALAGGQIWLSAEEQVPIAPDERLSRLLLMSPATGFFQAPGALDSVRIPTSVWAGTDDLITPPTQAHFLKERLGDQVKVHLMDRAGHFSFMDTLPPQVTDPIPNREAFLTHLAAEIQQSCFVKP